MQSVLVSATEEDANPTAEMPSRQMVTTMNILQKFRSEFARMVRGEIYDRTPDGILFPRQSVLVRVGGGFAHKVDDGPWAFDPNTFMDESLNDLLNVYFGGASQPTAWYIAPYTNDINPPGTLTAATFSGTLSELTNYTESVRQSWTKDANSTAKSMTNSVAPATFTIGAGGASVYGACMVSGASAKGATTGKLGAAALFDTPNTLAAGSKLMVQYIVAAQSV